MNTRIHPRAARLALPLLLAAAALLPGPASAQARHVALLSNRPPARRGCRIAPRPAQLPALAALADSATLLDGLGRLASSAGIAQGDTAFVLYSVAYDAEGAVTRLEEIESYYSTAAQQPTKELLRSVLRPQRGPGYLRLRVEPGLGRVRVGHSEVCFPDAPEIVDIQGLSAYVPAPPPPMRARIMVNEAGRVLSAVKVTSTGNYNVDEMVLRWLTDRHYGAPLVDGLPTTLEFEHTVRFQSW